MDRKKEENNEKDGKEKQHPSRRVDSDKNGNDSLEYYDPKGSSANENNDINSIQPLPTRRTRPVSRPGAFRVDGFRGDGSESMSSDDQEEQSHEAQSQSRSLNDDEYSVFVIPSASLVQEGVDLDDDDDDERRTRRQPEATVSPELVHASPLHLGILQPMAPTGLQQQQPIQPETPKDSIDLDTKQNIVINKRWAILLTVTVCLILSIVAVGVTLYIVKVAGTSNDARPPQQPPNGSQPPFRSPIETQPPSRPPKQDGGGGGSGGGGTKNLRRRLKTF